MDGDHSHTERTMEDGGQTDELGYATELPAGYRFRPSDEELMTYYLCNKVLDRPVPGRVVQNIDADALYSNSPDVVGTLYSSLLVVFLNNICINIMHSSLYYKIIWIQD